MSALSFVQNFIRICAEELAGSWAKQHVRPAFEGDVDAALSLYMLLGNAERGAMAEAMWRAKVSRPAYRAFLHAAWEHDHGHVRAAAGTLRRLQAMFRYAAFPLPTDLPAKLRVWRGTSNLTLAEASRGCSWTLNRNVACWFAMRPPHSGDQSLVLTAEVPKDFCVLYSDERGEEEVVILRRVFGAIVDGTSEAWKAGHKRTCLDRRAADLLALGLELQAAGPHAGDGVVAQVGPSP